MTETADELAPTEGDEPEQTDEPEQQDEPEPDDDEQPDADEQQAEPEQLSPIDNPDTWAAAERSAKTFRRRVGDLFAEDAVHLEPCPLCPDNLPGFVIPGAIPDELREQVIAWLRGPETADLNADPDTECCDVCGGHGRTLTGSPIPGKDTKMCGKCAEHGYTTKEQRESWRMTHPEPSVPYTPPPSAPTFGQTADGMPATDALGRPFGNPFYGHDPQYMTAAERESDPWSPKG